MDEGVIAKRRIVRAVERAVSPVQPPPKLYMGESTVKRDFGAKLLDLDGNPCHIGGTVEGVLQVLDQVLQKVPAEVRKEAVETLERVTGKPLTLASVCSRALISPYEDERTLDDTVRIARMELARKIHKGGVVDITPQERDMIKPLIKKAFNGVLIPVLTWELLEKDVEESPEAA